jgi:hypothetical protein
LGSNYGPLYKGKVGGAAQDVDNDNNNNGERIAGRLAWI